jgi:hypothetical protein
MISAESSSECETTKTKLVQGPTHSASVSLPKRANGYAKKKKAETMSNNLKQEEQKIR